MFTFPLSPDDVFVERAPQMASWGIPPRIVSRVRSRIVEMWDHHPGCWSFEWTREARVAETRGRWLLAATLYGAARFPCVCTPARATALAKQLECYIKAAPSFPCSFERRVLDDVNGARVPTHIFRPRWRRSAKRDHNRPILVLSGGVDTYKMELHRLALVLALAGGFHVAAIDMPGTGETPGVLSPNADATYLGVLRALRSESSSDVKVGIVGISFGGLWAAKLALRGHVDAGVDIGGPVGAAPRDADLLLRLPNGMSGIVANAMGFERLPSAAEVGRLLSTYSLREQGMLDPSPNRGLGAMSPLLAINGLHDPYISASDTTVFESFPLAEVWLTRDGEHCAAGQLKRWLPAMIGWLRMHLHGGTRPSRTAYRLAKLALPPLARAATSKKLACRKTRERGA